MTPLYPDGVYAPLPRFSKKTQTNNAPRATRSTASARRSLRAAAVSFASLSTCPPQCNLVSNRHLNRATIAPPERNWTLGRLLIRVSGRVKNHRFVYESVRGQLRQAPPHAFQERTPRVGRERVEPDPSQTGAHLQEDVESGMKQEGAAPGKRPGEPRACEQPGQLFLGGSERGPADGGEAQ